MMIKRYKQHRFIAVLCLLLLLTLQIGFSNAYDSSYRPDMKGDDWWWPVTDFQLPSHWWISDMLQGFYKYNDSWISFGGEYADKTPGRTSDNFVSEGWGGKGGVQIRMVEPTDTEHIFESPEDFLARGFLEGTDLSWLMAAEESDISQVSETTFQGYKAYRLDSEMYVDDGTWKIKLKEWAFFIPTDKGGILVIANAVVDWTDLGDFDPNWDRAEPMARVVGDVEGVLLSLRFRESGEQPGVTSTGQEPEDTAGDGVPWVTVAGGAVAVAAAGVALAGALAPKAGGSSSGKTEEKDPNQVVGYVLNVSEGLLTLQKEVGTALSIGVYAIYGDGHTKPVAANIQITAPSGVGIEPSQGMTPLNVVVWQTGDMAARDALAITATYGGSSNKAAVDLVPLLSHELAVTFEPSHKRYLMTTGQDIVTLVAKVIWPDMQALSQMQVVDAQRSIAFKAVDTWLSLSAPVDWEDGRAINVVSKSPDPTRQLTPPDKSYVQVTALVDGKALTQTVGIEIAPLPVFELSQDRVHLQDDKQGEIRVRGWIERGLDVNWQFNHYWRQGHKPLAEVRLETDGNHGIWVVIQGISTKGLNPSQAMLSSTLRLVASSPEYGEVERHLEIILAREGLFIDVIGMNPLDDTYPIDATGQGRPTRIDARVYIKDASGAISLSKELSAAVSWEPYGEEKSPGLTALRFPEFQWKPLGLRQLENPSATFEFVFGRKLPTAGDPIPAHLRAYVPDLEGAVFSTIVPLSLVGVNLAPFSEAWAVEKEACLTMIHEFAPKEMKERLYNLVSQHGATMGAEGLYELRKRIWRLSENAFRKEAADWMDYAWTLEQIEDTLEWVSWCGDIAFSVASGRITGTAAGIALGMLKPVLVSAITAYVEGKTMEEWGYEQLGMVLSVVEGQWTDPDFLQKISGASKAKIWAVFTAYTFIKNWAMDPQHSITKAMEDTIRMLRDQALISFLRRVTGTVPQADLPPEDSVPATGSGKNPRQVKSAKLAPEFEGLDPETRADKMGKVIKEKIQVDSSGKPKIDIETMEKIMRDPDGARVLKKADPDAWEAYHNARKEVYKNHDADLTDWIKKNVPNMEDEHIEVRNVGTDNGVDRDYRVGRVTRDPITGQEVFVEIPKEKWLKKSNQIFSEKVGGPTDPLAAMEYAQSHQQLGTDGYHSEAAVDMADQTLVKDPSTGEWVKTQKIPNVDLVKAGKRILDDPDGLGKTYETKVANSYYTNNKLDAYTQAAKATHTLEGVRDGYNDQGYTLKQAPAEIAKGMEIIDQVASGKLKPDAADEALRQAGLGSDLPGFMEKVSAQFANLKLAKKRT